MYNELGNGERLGPFVYSDFEIAKEYVKNFVEAEKSDSEDGICPYAVYLKTFTDRDGYDRWQEKSYLYYNPSKDNWSVYE